MDLREFARRLPKTELHNHLHGTLTDATLRKVAAANSITVPANFMEIPKRYENLKDFLGMLRLITRAVQTAEDFYLVTYEMLAESAKHGARYMEFFFSPHAHMQHGARYARMLEGITRAMSDAQADHSIVSRIIPAHNRELGPDKAIEFIEMVKAERIDEVIGVGLDFNEAPNPPGAYVAMYDEARKAGLKTTAHAGEDGPAEFVRSALDDLKCMRIDHGYAIIDDPELVRRCVESKMLFTVCPTTTLSTTRWTNLASGDHAIQRMKEAGLKICINTDDSSLFGTDLTNEYVVLGERAGFTADDLADAALNGLRYSWLDAASKEAWLAQWQVDVDALVAEFKTGR